MSDDLDWTGRNSLLIGPTLTALGFVIAASQTPPVTVTLVAAPGASQYLRVYTLDVIDKVDGSASYNGDVASVWFLATSTGAVPLEGDVGFGRKSVHLTFPGGLPFPFGSRIDGAASSAGWADAELAVTMTYSVVG